MELKRTYDTFVPPSQSVTCCKDGPTRIYPLSFGCNLTRKQMIGITACANAYHLFCVSTLHVEDMEALLSCKEGFCIRVNNIRHVAILFDTLLEHSFIQANGSPFSVMGGSCKPRMEKDSFQLQAFHPLCLPCVTT